MASFSAGVPLTFADISFDFSCGGAAGFTEGMVLESVHVAGVDAKRAVYGTTMRVELGRPLAPKARVSCARKRQSTTKERTAGLVNRSQSRFRSLTGIRSKS